MFRILNLHGLLGHAHNSNYRILTNSFDVEVISPQLDLEMNPHKVLETLEGDYDCIVANSFGGFFGYVLSSKLDVPAILCNPCIPPADYILDLVPNYKYIAALETLWGDYKNLKTYAAVILGDNDTILDPCKSALIFHRQHKPIYTVDEGHKLSSSTFEYILKYEVKKCLEC